MPSAKPVSNYSISSEAVFYWLIDMLSNEGSYAEWTNLVFDQRHHWLENRGYCYLELQQALQALNQTDIDLILLQTLTDFVMQGVPIPNRSAEPLEALAHQRIAATLAQAGGYGAGYSASSREKLKKQVQRYFPTAKASISEAHEAYKEASETKLGEYIEIGGGIEIDVHEYLENQIVTKSLEAHTFLASKAKPIAESQLHAQKTDYDREKEKFITQTTENAVQKEKFITQTIENAVPKEQTLIENFSTNDFKLGTKEKSIEQIDKQYYDHTYKTKEKSIEQIDKQYYDHTYKTEVQAGFIVKPTYSISDSGKAPELTVNYDWKGDRSTFVLNKNTATADLDPALFVVDNFTARALWNAKLKADYKSDLNNDVKQYGALGVNITDDLQKFHKHYYPKAKLPQTLNQFVKDKKSLEKSLMAKQRKAHRQGLTLLSLQRQRDEKRIENHVQSWQMVQGHNAAAEAKETEDYKYFQTDRLIEVKLTNEYGSLRAQKLILNQARIDIKVFQTDMHLSIKRLKIFNHLMRSGDYHPNKIDQIYCGILEYNNFKYDLSQCINTKPYLIKKNSNGKGYSFVPATYNKDYWQTLTQKQRYNIFNPAYQSETRFYNTEKIAFLAGSSTYLDLRKAGATKKTARLGASAAYFATLFETDKAEVKTESKASKLRYAPSIFERQLNVAKKVVHLNRHSFAFKFRVAFKVKQETLLFKESTKEDNYMKNNKFTGFHPFHRIARKTVKWTKVLWHYTGRIMYRHEAKWFNEAMGGMFGSKTQTWLAKAEKKTASAALFVGWQVLKGFWKLPGRLIRHTKHFEKQALFAITHPWKYREIWTGIKKDFRGIYRLAKFIFHDIIWTISVYYRIYYQIGRAIGGKGTNWDSIVKGAYHKRLYKKVRMFGMAFKFSSLATLVGKDASTRGAIQLMELRMHLRRDLHRLGFGKSPIKFFINQHSQLVDKQVKELKPSQISDLHKKIHSGRHYLKTHEKKLVLDHHKYKANLTYRDNVNYFFQALISSNKALLAPKIQVYMKSTTHKLIDEISKVNDKHHKITHWTDAQFDLDLTEYMHARNAYKGLRKSGRKEVAASLIAFKDLNGFAKQGTIKQSMAIFNRNAKVVIDYNKKIHKICISDVTNDWSHFGIYIGQKMMNTLLFSIQSSSEKKVIKTFITKSKLGKSFFFDIVGGFEINSYIRKDPSFVQNPEYIKKILLSSYTHIGAFISQPVFKKVSSYWFKANPNSLITKDDLWIRSYHKKLEKDFHQIKKWRHIEKIGHIKVTASDLSILDKLHKNMILGQSFATLIGHTSKWKGLSLQQQQQYRTQYNHWLNYNQTSYHVFKKVKATVIKNDTSEAAAWKTDKSSINSGSSKSVGFLILSVKNNDKGKNSSWLTIPKLNPSKDSLVVSLTNFQETFANIISNPRLLSVAFTTNLGNGSHAKDPNKYNPSLFAYYHQIKHWTHKINKWLKPTTDEDDKVLEGLEKRRKYAYEDWKAAQAEEKKINKQVGEGDKNLQDGNTSAENFSNNAQATVDNDESVVDSNPGGNKFTEKLNEQTESAQNKFANNENGEGNEISEEGIKRKEENLEDETRNKVDENQNLEDTKKSIHDVNKFEKSPDSQDITSDLTADEEKDVSRIVRKEFRDAFIATEDDFASVFSSGSTELEGEIEGSIDKMEGSIDKDEAVGELVEENMDIVFL